MNNPRKRLDDNLHVIDDVVSCSRCDAVVGSGANWLAHALISERPAEEGGTLMRVSPATYVDAAVVYRQAFCPGCTTVLQTEIIAAADRRVRIKRVAPTPPS